MKIKLFSILTLFFIAIGLNAQQTVGTIFTVGGFEYKITVAGTASASSVREVAVIDYLDVNNFTPTIPSTVFFGTTYNVTSIGEEAFRSNSLTSVSIPSSIILIGEDAFLFNSLTSVSIPNSVTSIGQSAFSSNPLTNITIPASVTTIGAYAFNYNSSLVSVVSESTNPAFLLSGVFDNNNSIDLTIPTGLEQTYLDANWVGFNTINTIDYTFTQNNIVYQILDITNNNIVATYDYIGTNTTISIPATVTNAGSTYNVTTIGDASFDYNSLTEVTIPASVTTIRAAAFKNNSLTSITIPASVTTIGASAFENNYYLTDVTSESITPATLLSFTFSNNNIDTDLTIPENTTTAYTTAGWVGFKSITEVASPCTVNIPDTKFKTYLVGNAAINTNGDTEIQCSEASAFTGTIDVSSLTINYLTGIEAFINITELNCNYNNYISSIDVSANTALTSLACNGNVITSLDISNNTALKYLDCANNLISSLDVSANIALTTLACNGNLLTSLDVSQNTLLINLWCHINQLTSLDVTNNIKLEFLTLNYNQLTSLDVSNNTALEQIQCFNNQLTSLDVSNNTVLEQLHCSNNQLTSLDLSNNTALTRLSCAINQLTSLNVANGNNSNIVTASFYAGTNPNLTCVTVDDVAYSDANWTNIDAQTSFSTNCGALSLDDFSLNTVSIYPNPTTSVLNIKMDSNLKSATIYSVLGIKILETSSKNITTSNLNKGIYLIKIETENGNISKKRFMKE